MQAVSSHGGILAVPHFGFPPTLRNGTVAPKGSNGGPPRSSLLSAKDWLPY